MIMRRNVMPVVEASNGAQMMTDGRNLIIADDNVLDMSIKPIAYVYLFRRVTASFGRDNTEIINSILFAAVSMP